MANENWNFVISFRINFHMCTVHEKYVLIYIVYILKDQKKLKYFCSILNEAFQLYINSLVILNNKFQIGTQISVKVFLFEMRSIFVRRNRLFLVRDPYRYEEIDF